MNLQQKTQLLTLEFENAALKQGRPLKRSMAETAARANVDVFVFAEDGSPPVGIGGMTIAEYIAWLFEGRPEDFEATTTN
jgi:hypothetical protein